MATNKKTLRVLIADDEKAIAGALKLKFEHEGVEVMVATNGFDALKMMDSQKFDLLVLDLVMPKLDGFGVLELLKSRGNTVPVVVASNLGQEVDVARAKELGASDFLIKSDTPVLEIVRKIKKIISK